MFAKVVKSVIYFVMVKVFALTEVLGLPAGKPTEHES